MTAAELRGETRRLLGVRANEVPDREIDSFLIPAIVWLAEQLKFDIVTDESIGISESQVEVPLPKDLSFMIWVEWNSTRLTPTSPYALDRDNPTWRSQTAATPTQFAIQGRNLILNPPPDSTSITADSTLSWRYISSGNRLPESGVAGLSESDEMLIRYDAAVGWLSAHISDENQAKVAAFSQQIKRRLPEAKRRWENAITPFYPSVSVRTYRFGGSR